MKVRDLDLNVQIIGEGTPFIWAHGLMSSMEGEDLMDWFGWHDFPKNIKLIRYDARGHGKSQLSEKTEDYHWRNLGQDMLALADAVNIEQFIAGGDSMGCATTLYATLQAPERVKAMVLVIPPTIWETRAAQGKRYKQISSMVSILSLFGGKIVSKVMSRSMADLLPAWMIKAEPEMLTKMAAEMGAVNPKTVVKLMQGAAATDLPPREDLRKLETIPAIILGWVDDPTHPVISAEELHKLLPKSELFIAKGYEESKIIPQRIRDFVLKYA